MNQHDVRMGFSDPFPYNPENNNTAFPVCCEDMCNVTNKKVMIASTGHVMIEPDMAQDDILAIMARAWASRPQVNNPDHPDYKISVMMRALIMTFENAAWQTHGYTLDQDRTRSVEIMRKGLVNAPSLQQVNEVYRDVITQLSTLQ
jgi:hypothetical protein